MIEVTPVILETAASSSAGCGGAFLLGLGVGWLIFGEE